MTATRFSTPHMLLVHVMTLLLILPPQAVLADMLTSNTLGAGAGAAGTPADTSAAAANAVNSAAAAAQARANAQDMLTRNTLALDAVQAMQAAAHAAAATMNNAGANPNFVGQTLPDVPDGLVAGGLQFTSATGATSPTQSIQNARTIVEIQQTQQQAMIEWNSFNIGRQTTLRFDQSAGGADVGSWIAFNRITDPSGNPSQILGSIEAQGQVYVINQNGIIFGGVSEVNTGSMVASSLPINDNLVTRGLLNNPDSQFLFSANAQSAGSKGPTPSYTPPALPASGKIGNVTVQAGARLTAPTSSANVGGRVALIGPNVTNNGTISTPDGQTILAAGMQVGFDAHSTDDPSLRGLDVFVGDVGSYGGAATNGGLIESARGSVVIAGKDVNQNGFINSSTSVALNGRIDLLANYNAVSNINNGASGQGGPFVYAASNSTGTVRNGAGSVSQILPEWASEAKVVGTELALKSQLTMQGLGIYMGSNAVVLAPNANVALSAGVWDLFMSTGTTQQSFVQAGGQVYLDQGAVIDVAGSTGVATSINDYLLTVTLRGAELADSALQRNGGLRGTTVTVDLRNRGVRSDGTEWVGTPLANLTSYLGVIGRNVGQLTTAGGTVSMTAGTSVVMQNGARVNVSGGYQDFAPGSVATTRLVDDGNLVDIASADPNVVYDGVYTGSTSVTDARWGTTTTTTGLFVSNAHEEPGYTDGGNGGSIEIAAAAMALDGSLRGNTVIGNRQLEAAPLASSLSLTFEEQLNTQSPFPYPFISPTPPSLEFRNGGGTLTSADAFTPGSWTLRSDRLAQVFLPSELLTTQGFGSLLVDNSDGRIFVPADVSLRAPVGGVITLRGSSLDVLGSLSAPSGHIELLAYNFSPFSTKMLKAQGGTATTPPVNPSRGKLTLGSAASLSTAGLIINDSIGSSVPHFIATRSSTGAITSVSTTQGGSISIQSYSADLQQGSVMDVSGGLVANKAIAYGNGGRISIQAGQDPGIASLLGGELTLGSTLRGFSGANGGALSLQTATIQVGGSSSFPNTLLLQPEFFSAGGFSQFTLTGLGTDITPPGGAETMAPGIVIAAGAVIRPAVSSLQASITAQGGGNLILVRTLLQPEGYRGAAKLDFEAPGIVNPFTNLLMVRGHISMGLGSQIVTDALGSVIMRGQTLEMLGAIDAPGGTVTLSAAGQYPVVGSVSNALAAFTTLHMGSASRVSTAGKAVLLNDVLNRRSGFVYAGGSIQMTGNIVVDVGSSLDVSGASAVLDLLPTEAGLDQASQNSVTQLATRSASIPTRIDSNGGQIALRGNEFLFSRATLLGAAGGSKAQGGSVSVSSGHFVPLGAAHDDKDITLFVSQDMALFAQPVFVFGRDVVGQSLGNGIVGRGYFGANSFQNGGFDALTLSGNVEFKGAVNVAARASIAVATGGVLAADALVQISAPYVALGRPLAPPLRDDELTNPFSLVDSLGQRLSVFSPTSGTGRIDVVADLIDTGFLSLQNIGQVNLTAQREMRGSGYFDINGDLSITAGQIYPVTASTFTITAYGNSRVTLRSSGRTPQFPLSGGGRLSIYAATIDQGGTLRAPFGSIRLGWDGSGAAPKGLVTNVSVPVTQQLTLASGSMTSVSAIDPQTGAGVTIPYGIVKDGTNWIDPTGLDITSIGVPDKTIRLSALNVSTQANSQLDIRGGGELYGYRWIKGNGGTVDTLDSTSKFAILPSYIANSAPFAPFATVGVNVSNLNGDEGYRNDSLRVGDQIYMKGSALLAAGNYTLLPARYALLPGALLITPSTGTPVDSYVKAGGAVLTSGYRFNSLNPSASNTIYQSYEIAPQNVVKARSEYADFAASSFISSAQQQLSVPVARTTLDAGYALIGAQQAMLLDGNVSAAGSLTGRGGRVDISSPLDIIIAAPGATAQVNKLTLNASLLSGWNAESLLIGGERTSATTVTARATNLTLNNATAPLTGAEIILVAKEKVTLADNAQITQRGTQTAADALVINGNGALVRVSGVTTAQTSRSGVTTSVLPQLNVGLGVRISGPSITLDSTNATSLDNSTSLIGRSINLNSGRVSLLLTNPGVLQSGSGLVLGGTALSSLQSTEALSLLSYSSLDLYGTGSFSNTGTLALHAGEIRGFNNGGGDVQLAAKSMLLDNSANGSIVGPVSAMSGRLNLTADTISIGQNALAVSQYAAMTMNAKDGVLMQGVGSFRTQGQLSVVTPFFAATASSNQSMTAGGALTLSKPSGPQMQPSSLGLGAQLAFVGSSITADTDVLLPSGLISLRALTGALSIGGRLDAGGTAKSFFDQVRYTDAGQVILTADSGAVSLSPLGAINVAAAAGAGNAGSLSIQAPNPTNGRVTLDGTLTGSGGQGGSTNIDLGSLTDFNGLNAKLNSGGFNREQLLRVRTGSVSIDSVVNAQHFLLSADQGSITVNGTINAAGSTGGRIDLIASNNVIISSGAILDVSGLNFDSAGKGGAVWLEAGAYVNNSINPAAILDVRTGSTINLSVAAQNASSAQRGQFSGTLHLRAPQSSSTEVLGIKAIGASIQNASSIVVEGYQVFDLTGSGIISSTVQTNVRNNGTSFGGNGDAIATRLLNGRTDISSVLVVMPGAEIVNRTGSLTLGTTTSASSSDWNLATFRFGTKSAPGVLTLRAAGNLEFYNTLSDGFTVGTTGNTVERMWLAPLTARNNLLPVNTQSWSYRMAAGADFSATNFRTVMPLTSLSANTGSLLLGKDAGQALPSSSGINSTGTADALTRLSINPNNFTGTTNGDNRFQVIRTGTGDIEISTGRDVQLLNQFATIYTAGVTVPSATTIFNAADFVLPNVTSTVLNQGALGAIQQTYGAQFSMAGGNVSVAAQSDIVHLTRDGSNNLIMDSQRELPNNWLMRRGYVDSAGNYGVIRVSSGGANTVNDTAASTAWWVNFSNFFDGIAALGGGNVTLNAGRDVQNVSAHAPTNARAVRGVPSAANLLELGGGDVVVQAGRNIDAGVYYVERGTGTLRANGAITTNATRSPSLGRLGVSPDILPQATWLPTTLFVGKSSFKVSARENLLLGPVANTMLLPQGLNNKHWYKTYFSTYAENSGVSLSSLGGDITIRQAATLPSASQPESMLMLWMQKELFLSTDSAGIYQPWLRLVETDVAPFRTLSTLMPSTLQGTAFSGDINLIGSMTLSPSATGTLDLLAADAIHGLVPTGVSSVIVSGSQTNVWASSSVNLSDANPVSIPSALTPFGYHQVFFNPLVTNNNSSARVTNSEFLKTLDSTFAESGSTSGTYASTQIKQRLHASGLLHANDRTPVRLYAAGGDVSGVTLFAGKSATILAEQDITDIAFYIQNVHASDTTVVSSGRDIIAYNANSVLRSLSNAAGNLPAFGEVPKAGDIQISGPGSLEVLAGRNLNLGTGSNNADGTGVGITSIGNGRNPNLPFAGADVVIAAGMGSTAAGLSGSAADFTSFINKFATSPDGDRYLTELASMLGVASIDLSNPIYTAEQQKQLALVIYYLVLRDAGRDRNDPASPNAGTYVEGYRAIGSLFPATNPGNILTQARDIRTKSGGDISILTPDGGLQLAPSIIGETLAPPGIITESGGSISIFANNDVNIGISRIFTLRGGDIMIWSSEGNIAAGSSSKTVQSAPPTRVLIDPQSANVATDLAGLATGGGIGVLATVLGVAPGNVDLIAPIGAVDAGDAGIRATGNLNIAASIVLNAANISVAGSSGGTPSAPSVSAPSIGGLASAASAGAAASNSPASQAAASQQQQVETKTTPSVISVEVLGYGGGGDEDEESRRKSATQGGE